MMLKFVLLPCLMIVLLLFIRIPKYLNTSGIVNCFFLISEEFQLRQCFMFYNNGPIFDREFRRLKIANV